MKTKKGAKKELLNLDESRIIATTVFELKKFEMKDDMQWRMKLLLKTSLPQSFREYKVKLSLNEQPFNVRIADLERKRSEVETEETLFPDQRKKQCQNIDLEIKEVEKELADTKANAPEIEFQGTIEELKYKEGDTLVMLQFPSVSLKELNDNRMTLKHYKIELIRE